MTPCLPATFSPNCLLSLFTPPKQLKWAWSTWSVKKLASGIISSFQAWCSCIRYSVVYFHCGFRFSLIESFVSTLEHKLPEFLLTSNCGFFWWIHLWALNKTESKVILNASTLEKAKIKIRCITVNFFSLFLPTILISRLCVSHSNEARHWWKQTCQRMSMQTQHSSS